MIDISEFKRFLNEVFTEGTIYIDKFKPYLQFAEIDCFSSQPVKLAIEISPEMIKMDTISKEPAIDFSLYEYLFDDIAEAKNFILQIKTTGVFPRRNRL